MVIAIKPLDHNAFIQGEQAGLQNIIRADALNEGIRQRQALMEAGGLAADGDLSGARNNAFRAGLIGQGVSFENLGAQRTTRANAAQLAKRKEQLAREATEAEALSRGAMAAQTPEQYQVFIADAQNRGIQVPDVFRDFNNREMLARRSLSVADQLKFRLQSEMNDIRKMDVEQRAARGAGTQGNTEEGLTKSFREKYASGRTNGLSHEQATAFASGLLALKTDPLTGNTIAVNKATGQEFRVTPETQQQVPEQDGAFRPIDYAGPAQVAQQTQVVPGRQQSAVPQQRPAPKTLYEQVDLATGATQTLGALASDVTETIPVFGGKIISEDARRAQQDFKLAQNDLVRNLAINKKFPVSEMNRIKGFLQPGILTSSDKLRSEMETTGEYLRSMRDAQMELLQDTSMPKEDRRTAKTNIFWIDKFLKKLGAPAPGTQPAGGASEIKAPAVGTIEDNHRFKGGDPSKPENWERLR